MALQRLTPKGLFKPASYSQLVVATGRQNDFRGGASLDR